MDKITVNAFIHGGDLSDPIELNPNLTYNTFCQIPGYFIFMQVAKHKTPTYFAVFCNMWEFLILNNYLLYNTLSDHSRSTGFQCLCGFCPLLYIIGILPSKIISVLSGLSPIYALFKYSDEQKPVRLPYAT